MEHNPIECLRCGDAMVIGVLIDQYEGGYLPTYWVKGFPPKGVRYFEISNDQFAKAKIEVKTFRCEICGYLESYAV